MQELAIGKFKQPTLLCSAYRPLDNAFYKLVIKRLSRKPSPIKKRTNHGGNEVRRILVAWQFPSLLGTFNHQTQRSHESGVEPGVKTGDLGVALSRVDYRWNNGRPSC